MTAEPRVLSPRESHQFQHQTDGGSALLQRPWLLPTPTLQPPNPPTPVSGYCQTIGGKEGREGVRAAIGNRRCGGAGLRVDSKFQDIPRFSPLGAAVWGSAYTGLLTLEPPVSRPHHPAQPPGMTQDPVTAWAQEGGEASGPDLINHRTPKTNLWGDRTRDRQRDLYRRCKSGRECRLCALPLQARKLVCHLPQHGPQPAPPLSRSSSCSPHPQSPVD